MDKNFLENLFETCEDAREEMRELQCKRGAAINELDFDSNSFHLNKQNIIDEYEDDVYEINSKVPDLIIIYNSFGTKMKVPLRELYMQDTYPDVEDIVDYYENNYFVDDFD